VARDGRLLYILHRVENVTDFVLSQQANETLREQSRTLVAELNRSEAEASRRNAALNVTTNALQRLTEEAEAWRLGEEKFKLVTNALPQIIWTALPDGYIDYRNQHFYDFTGATRKSTDVAEWKMFVHPDDLAGVEATWGRSVAMGQHSGEYRWTLARAIAVRSDDGTILKWVGSTPIFTNRLLRSRNCGTPIDARMNFLRCSRTNCAIRSHRSAPEPNCFRRSAQIRHRSIASAA
jgi:PAS domain-containing protein